MTQPSTGTTWTEGGFNDFDSRLLERGGLIAVGIRDARGIATDLSPHNPDGTINWSPFALDNTIRNDLWARNLSAGVWTPNPDDNQGFFKMGAFKEGDGPSTNPKIDTDDFMIEQSNFPFDSLLTKEDEPFSLVPVQTADPAIRRLRYDLPFSDSDGNLLVEDPGAIPSGWARLLDAVQTDRQALLLRCRMVEGLPLYKVDVINLCRISDIGDAKQGKKDAEASKLSFKPLPDGIFMAMQDGAYVPIIKYTWEGGPAWAAIGGLPKLSSTPPTATPTTTGKATLVFAEPSGGNGPFTVKVQSATSGPTGPWTDAVLDNSFGVGGPNVTNANGVTDNGTTFTAFVKTLTAGTTYLRAVVTGTNGASANTPSSASVTIT